MITLRDLQYLVALDTHRHFGRAAEACFVSQPTLSGQFRKLEERLGLTLVERNRHQVVMTPAGEQLALRARSLIAGASEFEQHASALLDPLTGDIHLGLVPTVAPYLLSRVISAITGALPELHLFLHEYQTAELIKRLDSGTLDLLILPWKPEMECFGHINLFSEPLQLAAPQGHAILKAKQLSLDSLKGERVLTLEDGHCLRDDTLGVCFSAGAQEDPKFQATSLETLRYMVANGLGITLMPELAITNDTDLGIVYRRFLAPEPQRQIAAVFRKGYPRMECVNAIARTVQSSIRLGD